MMKNLRLWPLASLCSVFLWLAVAAFWPNVFETAPGRVVGSHPRGEAGGHAVGEGRTLFERALSAGSMQAARGDYAAAEHHIASALRKAERFGESDQRLGIVLDSLARVYAAQTRYAKAEPLLMRAVVIGENTWGPGNLKLGVLLSRLAQVQLMQGQPAKAQEVYERALALVETYHGANRIFTAVILHELGIALHAQGKDEAAEPIVRRALGLREAALGPNHGDVAISLNNLAVLLRGRRDYEAAEALYRRAVDALARTELPGGSAHPYLANILESYAVLLRETGRAAEADAAETRARAIKAR